MNYSDRLKDERWQKKRLEILKRDNFSCLRCNAQNIFIDDNIEYKGQILHVHHIKYIGEPWDIENKYLITLCENCHLYLHNIKDKNEFEYEFEKLNELLYFKLNNIHVNYNIEEYGEIFNV